MNNFFPHDLVGWVGIGVPFFGVLAWVLKITVGDKMSNLTNELNKLSNILEAYDNRIDDLDRRTYRLEIITGLEKEKTND
ncbi:hypothetical protein LIX87_01200 [Weissella viridescens]|jgi:hypothetical protein|uniref:hypothetical protein n=1 Tax=Weissella viridescens TaxID=1629 RepID=UPI001C7E160E|nr:hypothetical protein [Weissella viridescens]MBX4172546.1 hypothetical protein [Weissella viridescens]MCB6839634.1 hypothetical protein [Weissella viridescens]MCB6846365.1 hypothetical protein [Weissella viridescens]